MGWSWGYAPSSAHDNLLEANHLHHLGRGVLNDLGAIYTLGISPGTVERSNLMHDIRCYNFGGWGVYTDEGSTGILIEKNIVYNTSSGCFHQHYGKENVLRNNVFAFGEEGVLRRSREEDHTSFIFERNIVLSRGSPFHIVAWTNGRYQIDSNLYWDYGEKEPKFSGMSIAEWQAKGRDRKSILADPLCADPAGFDFSLKEGSPAASIGFEPIDTSRIGLYGSREWVEAPRKFQRTARQAVPPATPEPVEAARGAEKRLVEFGWDEPDTAFLRRHIDEMEKTPFDGCVFHVNYQKPGGGSGSFTWESWSKRAFSEAELQAALEDLRGTKFRRFTHNFLRFNTTPADLDWFDDFSAVAANARLAAGLAREGKARGLLFDIEQYNGQLFDYRRQRDVKTRTWEAYAAQARRRGREVMEAFQAGFPDLVAFLTFGYSLPWSQSQGGKKPLAECSYGLLAPFLDGMLEAARGKARIVDGHELSYGYRDPAQFEAARRRMRDELLPIVADPQAYRRVFSLSFGIWMDHDWRKNGWDTGEPQRNYFPPEAFGAAVQKALQTADEYVWIYSETPRWWSPEGTPVKLPPAYTEALRSARKGLAPDS